MTLGSISRFLARLLFSVLLFLFLFEIGLRLSGIYLTYGERSSNSYGSIYVADPRNVNLYDPNSSNSYITNEFTYDHRSNSIGYREREPAATKDSLERRVLLVGDSFVEGVGADQDSTWTRQLEEQFQSSLANPDIKVYSAGMIGSDLFYGYQLLDKAVDFYEPDVVVLTLNNSDFQEYLVRGGMARFDHGDTLIFSSPISYESYYRMFHIVRFFVHRIEGRDYTFNTEASRAKILRNGMVELVKVIKDYQVFCARRQLEFVFLIYPIPGDVDMFFQYGYDPYGNEEMNALRTLLDENGIDYTDMLPCLLNKFHDEHQLEAYYWYWDGHFNARGYSVMADCSIFLIDSVLKTRDKGVFSSDIGLSTP